MNYPYFLDPPVDNNRISELLKDKQVTVKQLIEDSQFLSYYQMDTEELQNFINKEQSIGEIIDIISEAAKAPVYFENEPIYMDNIEMYEERTKHLHIISEIFYTDRGPFCQIFCSHSKSLVKLFECFKLDINPLVGGLLYKIIRSLCQCDPEKFVEHISENKWILNDLLGLMKNQFALDILVQIAHSSVKFVKLAKDQKLAENLLLIIISNCESVSTQKQENCINMYDALIDASLEVLAQENSSELLEYLTSDYMLNLICSHVGLIDIESQIYIFAFLKQLTRVRDASTDNHYNDESSTDDKHSNTSNQELCTSTNNYDELIRNVIKHIHFPLRVLLNFIDLNPLQFSSKDIDRLNVEIFGFLNNLINHCPENMLEFEYIIRFLIANYFKYYNMTIYSLNIHESLVNIIKACTEGSDEVKNKFQIILDDTKLIENCLTEMQSINVKKSRSTSNIKLYQLLNTLYNKFKHDEAYNVVYDKVNGSSEQINFSTLRKDIIIPSIESLDISEEVLSKINQPTYSYDNSFERVVLLNNEDNYLDDDSDEDDDSKDDFEIGNIFDNNSDSDENQYNMNSDPHASSGNDVSHDRFMYFVNSNNASAANRSSDSPRADQGQQTTHKFRDSELKEDTNNSAEFNDIWDDESYDYHEQGNTSDSSDNTTNPNDDGNNPKSPTNILLGSDRDSESLPMHQQIVAEISQNLDGSDSRIEKQEASTSPSIPIEKEVDAMALSLENFKLHPNNNIKEK